MVNNIILTETLAFMDTCSNSLEVEYIFKANTADKKLC